MKKNRIKRLSIIFLCVLIVLVVFHPIVMYCYYKGSNSDTTFISIVLSKETWRLFPIMCLAYIFTFFFVVVFVYAGINGSDSKETKEERERMLAASKYADKSAQYRSSFATGNPSRIRNAANERDQALAKLISKTK